MASETHGLAEYAVNFLQEGLQLLVNLEGSNKKLQSLRTQIDSDVAILISTVKTFPEVWSDTPGTTQIDDPKLKRVIARMITNLYNWMDSLKDLMKDLAIKAALLGLAAILCGALLIGAIICPATGFIVDAVLITLLSLLAVVAVGAITAIAVSCYKIYRLYSHVKALVQQLESAQRQNPGGTLFESEFKRVQELEGLERFNKVVELVNHTDFIMCGKSLRTFIIECNGLCTENLLTDAPFKNSYSAIIYSEPTAEEIEKFKAKIEKLLPSSCNLL